jgi:hypothetical protein
VNAKSALLTAVLILVAVGLLALAAACKSGGDGGDSTGDQGTPSEQETKPPADDGADDGDDGGDDGGAGLEVDPCELVTKEDAAALLGGTVPEPERQTVGPFESCFYTGSGIFDFVQAQVGSDVWTESEFDDSIQSSVDFIDIEADSVSGLGDKAYWLEGILWVLDGDVAFNLWVSNEALSDPDKDESVLQEEALAVTTELAETVLGRLP